MEKRDRGFKVIAVVALLIATVGLTIAYAGYTATLKIGGESTTATVSSDWKILWKNLATSDSTGYAQFDTSAGKLAIDSNDDQTISGIIGTLKVPGDSLKFTFDAANDGDINADLSKITLGGLECTPASVGSGETPATSQQASDLCAQLSVEFTYGGTAVTAGDVDPKIALPAGSTKPVTMTVKYNGTSNDTAVEINGPVVVTLGTTSFIYLQADAS